MSIMEVFYNPVPRVNFHISNKKHLWKTTIEALQVTRDIEAAFGTCSLGKYLTFVICCDSHRIGYDSSTEWAPWERRPLLWTTEFYGIVSKLQWPRIIYYLRIKTLLKRAGHKFKHSRHSTALNSLLPYPYWWVILSSSLKQGTPPSFQSLRTGGWILVFLFL